MNKKIKLYLDDDIDRLMTNSNLDIRIYNGLLRAGMFKIGDIFDKEGKLKEEVLLSLRNIGVRSINRLKQLLAEEVDIVYKEKGGKEDLGLSEIESKVLDEAERLHIPIVPKIMPVMWHIADICLLFQRLDKFLKDKGY